MTLCIWQDSNPAFGQLFLCRRCGGQVTRDATIAVLPFRRVCTARTQQERCRFFGAPRRTIVCPSCRGNVRVKVFECALHGECTAGKALDRLPCCRSCGDYQPAATSAEASE